MYGLIHTNQMLDYPVKTCKSLRVAKRIAREYFKDNTDIVDMFIVFLLICPKNKTEWFLLARFTNEEQVIKFKGKRGGYYNV